MWWRWHVVRFVYGLRGDDHVLKFLHHFHTVRGVQNKKEEKTHVCEIHFELRPFELRQ